MQRREDPRGASAQRKGQVRTEREGSCLQAKERSLARNKPGRHLDLDFQPPQKRKGEGMGLRLEVWSQ